jgi:hypothetical protein
VTNLLWINICIFNLDFKSQNLKNISKIELTVTIKMFKLNLSSNFCNSYLNKNSQWRNLCVQWLKLHCMQNICYSIDQIFDIVWKFVNWVLFLQVNWMTDCFHNRRKISPKMHWAWEESHILPIYNKQIFHWKWGYLLKINLLKSWLLNTFFENVNCSTEKHHLLNRQKNARRVPHFVFKQLKKGATAQNIHNFCDSKI